MRTGAGEAGGDASFWGGGVVEVGDAGTGEGALMASEDGGNGNVAWVAVAVGRSASSGRGTMKSSEG